MAEVRADIRDMALVGKIVEIRLAMNESYDYACAIVHSPSRLLKLDPEVHAKMQEDVAKRYYPGADAKMNKAVAAYGDLTGGIRASAPRRPVRC